MSMTSYDVAEMLADEALDVILPFMNEAGAYALARQKDILGELKADGSIVTQTDIDIGLMAQERFGSFLKRDGHLFICEETASEAGSPAEAFSRSTYQWIVDPIDGTATYAAGIPTWGIIVAVLKNGRPWLGAICNPAFGEIHFSDGNHAYRMKMNADRGQAAKVSRRNYTGQLLMTCHAEFYADIFRSKPPFIVVDFWGPINATWILEGKLRGSIHRDWIWDWAGGWAMARCMGRVFMELKSGRVLEQITADDLTDTWQLKNYMMLGASDDIDKVRASMVTV